MDTELVAGRTDVTAPPIVLDAVAATACPVKTRHAYEHGGRGVRRPLVPHRSGPGADGPDPAEEGRERERREFVASVLDRWLALVPGAVDLRGRDEDDRRARTARMLREGCPLVVAPALPTDTSGHRSGSPEALLRSAEGAGTPTYLPVLVRWHKILRRPRDDEEPEPEDARPRPAELDSPLQAGPPVPEVALRLDLRRADFLQLAHHHRLLQAVGVAGAPWGAVIGTDHGSEAPRLSWIRLDRPAVRVVDPAADGGWRTVTLLADADAELAHRVAIADAVGRPGVRPADVVQPVVVDECRSCPWWPACEDELDPDDLSARIARGRLDRIEVTALRSQRAGTVAELAAVPVEALLPTYLPLTAHRPDAERRLRAVARRARMLVRDEPIERETAGPIVVPAGVVEIDLDIETSAAGRIYLWGFALDEGGGPHYVEFSRFADLTLDEELDLARAALGWLRTEVERRAGTGEEDGRAPGTRVYHYSGYEVAMMTALAERAPDDEVLGWAATYAQSAFVDLLQIVQANFFGAVGLGLKQIAVSAGFHWRDPDPGGLNSQRWFDEAVHDETATVRAAARQRVLDYNEDDVRATARLRAWLRAQ